MSPKIKYLLIALFLCIGVAAVAALLTLVRQSVVVTASGKLAFVSDRDGQLHLYVLDDQGGAARLTSEQTLETSPAWSPTGDKLAFVRANGSAPDIYAVNGDGSAAVQLTTNGNSYLPAWSPDGNRIAFVTANDIYVMRADGQDVTRLTTAAAESFPLWSPDGRRILFLSSRSGQTQLYVMQSDGSGQVALKAPGDLTPVVGFLLEGGPYVGPAPFAWAPDGRRIALTTVDENQPAVYVLNADGSDPRRLTDSPWDMAPVWSPDGSKIAFLSGRDGERIEVYLMKADGSEQTRLTDSNSWKGRVTWSPDGMWLAFPSGSTGSTNLFKVKADGSAMTQLTDTQGTNWLPVWGR